MEDLWINTPKKINGKITEIILEKNNIHRKKRSYKKKKTKNKSRKKTKRKTKKKRSCKR